MANGIKKVAISPKAAFPQIVQQAELPARKKPGVRSSALPPGRPRKDVLAELPLPEGCKMLRYGRTEFDEQLGEDLIEAYYQHGGSLTRACRMVGVKYAKALEWKDTIPELKRALAEVDAIIDDEIRSQYKVRVLNQHEHNPTWKIFYMKSHFPEYAEKKQAVKITLDIVDRLMKPEVIEAEVTKPKDDNATGPEQPAALPPANTGKLLQGD